MLSPNFIDLEYHSIFLSYTTETAFPNQLKLTRFELSWGCVELVFELSKVRSYVELGGRLSISVLAQ